MVASQHQSEEHEWNMSQSTSVSASSGGDGDDESDIIDDNTSAEETYYSEDRRSSVVESISHRSCSSSASDSRSRSSASDEHSESTSRGSRSRRSSDEEYSSRSGASSSSSRQSQSYRSGDSRSSSSGRTRSDGESHASSRTSRSRSRRSGVSASKQTRGEDDETARQRSHARSYDSGKDSQSRSYSSGGEDSGSRSYYSEEDSKSRSYYSGEESQSQSYYSGEESQSQSYYSGDDSRSQSVSVYSGEDSRSQSASFYSGEDSRSRSRQSGSNYSKERSQSLHSGHSQGEETGSYYSESDASERSGSQHTTEEGSQLSRSNLSFQRKRNSRRSLSSRSSRSSRSSYSSRSRGSQQKPKSWQWSLSQDFSFQESFSGSLIDQPVPEEDEEDDESSGEIDAAEESIDEKATEAEAEEDVQLMGDFFSAKEVWPDQILYSPGPSPALTMRKSLHQTPRKKMKQPQSAFPPPPPPPPDDDLSQPTSTGSGISRKEQSTIGDGGLVQQDLVHVGGESDSKPSTTSRESLGPSAELENEPPSAVESPSREDDELSPQHVIEESGNVVGANEQDNESSSTDESTTSSQQLRAEFHDSRGSSTTDTTTFGENLSFRSLTRQQSFHVSRSSSTTDITTVGGDLSFRSSTRQQSLHDSRSSSTTDTTTSGGDLSPRLSTGLRPRSEFHDSQGSSTTDTTTAPGELSSRLSSRQSSRSRIGEQSSSHLVVNTAPRDGAQQQEDGGKRIIVQSTSGNSPDQNRRSSLSLRSRQSKESADARNSVSPHNGDQQEFTSLGSQQAYDVDFGEVGNELRGPGAGDCSFVNKIEEFGPDDWENLSHVWRDTPKEERGSEEEEELGDFFGRDFDESALPDDNGFFGTVAQDSESSPGASNRDSTRGDEADDFFSQDIELASRSGDGLFDVFSKSTVVSSATREDAISVVSKKSRRAPTIGEYLPTAWSSSTSLMKYADDRTETEQSIGLVDVFGASRLGIMEGSMELGDLFGGSTNDKPQEKNSSSRSSLNHDSKLSRPSCLGKGQQSKSLILNENEVLQGTTSLEGLFQQPSTLLVGSETGSGKAKHSSEKSSIRSSASGRSSRSSRRPSGGLRSFGIKYVHDTPRDGSLIVGSLSGNQSSSIEKENFEIIDSKSPTNMNEKLSLQLSNNSESSASASRSGNAPSKAHKGNPWLGQGSVSTASRRSTASSRSMKSTTTASSGKLRRPSASPSKGSHSKRTSGSTSRGRGSRDQSTRSAASHVVHLEDSNFVARLDKAVVQDSKQGASMHHLESQVKVHDAGVDGAKEWSTSSLVHGNCSEVSLGAGSVVSAAQPGGIMKSCISNSSSQGIASYSTENSGSSQRSSSGSGRSTSRESLSETQTTMIKRSSSVAMTAMDDVSGIEEKNPSRSQATKDASGGERETTQANDGIKSDNEIDESGFPDGDAPFGNNELQGKGEGLESTHTKTRIYSQEEDDFSRQDVAFIRGSNEGFFDASSSRGDFSSLPRKKRPFKPQKAQYGLTIDDNILTDWPGSQVSLRYADDRTEAENSIGLVDIFGASKLGIVEGSINFGDLFGATNSADPETKDIQREQKSMNWGLDRSDKKAPQKGDILEEGFGLRGLSVSQGSSKSGVSSRSYSKRSPGTRRSSRLGGRRADYLQFEGGAGPISAEKEELNDRVLGIAESSGEFAALDGVGSKISNSFDLLSVPGSQSFRSSIRTAKFDDPALNACQRLQVQSSPTADIYNDRSLIPFDEKEKSSVSDSIRKGDRMAEYSSHHLVDMREENEFDGLKIASFSSFSGGTDTDVKNPTQRSDTEVDVRKLSPFCSPSSSTRSHDSNTGAAISEGSESTSSSRNVKAKESSSSISPDFFYGSQESLAETRRSLKSDDSSDNPRRTSRGSRSSSRLRRGKSPDGSHNSRQEESSGTYHRKSTSSRSSSSVGCESLAKSLRLSHHGRQGGISGSDAMDPPAESTVEEEGPIPIPSDSSSSHKSRREMYDHSSSTFEASFSSRSYERASSRQVSQPSSQQSGESSKSSTKAASEDEFIKVLKVAETSLRDRASIELKAEAAVPFLPKADTGPGGEMQSLSVLRNLSVSLQPALNDIHVSIRNEGYLEVVESAYMMILELRPRIRYMLSLAEWCHIHMLLLYARAYDCECAAASIVQSEECRIKVPNDLQVLEPLFIVLNSIGIVEDTLLGTRFIPVARPLHKRLSDEQRHLYVTPDPGDVTEFLEWTQYNWNSSWIKVEQAREARQVMATADGIKIPPTTLPSEKGLKDYWKLLEWENLALEKWLGWDEDLWVSYKQTVKMLEQKFRFVDINSSGVSPMGNYSWLLPREHEQGVETSEGHNENNCDSALVCRLPTSNLQPEEWMLALMFDFSALSVERTRNWYRKTNPVHDIRAMTTTFLQSAVRS